MNAPQRPGPSRDPQAQAARPRRRAPAGTGAIIAVVAIAAIIVAGLSYIYTSSQTSPHGIGVIGEATVATVALET